VTLQEEVTKFVRSALEEVTEGTETEVTVPARSIGDLVITTPGWQAVLKITQMRRTA
jgi:S-adenosylhomocysteine hydrolase